MSFAVVGVLFILGLIPVGVIGTFGSGIVSDSFWALSPSYALALGLDEVGVANFISAATFGGIVLQWQIIRSHG